MKKAFIIFVGILLGLFGLLSALDTSDYALEKRLWWIQKQYDKIAQDPSVVPGQRFDTLAKQYRSVIDRFPDSALVPKIYLQIGRVYAFKKDYDTARSSFEEILTRYPDDLQLCAEAMLHVGNTYETEQKQEQAIRTYKQVIDQYPLTEIGLNMPLYVANYYLKLRDQNKADAAMQNAVTHYRNMSRRYPQTQIEFSALRLLVTAYFGQKEWTLAVETLGRILLEFPDGQYLTAQRAELIIKSINTVSMTQLKDYDVPIGIYQKFIVQNPEHVLTPMFRKMIEALVQLKEKNVTVSATKNE